MELPRQVEGHNAYFLRLGLLLARFFLLALAKLNFQLQR